MIINNKYFPALIALPCFLPFMWRLFRTGSVEPIGLLSDFGCGILIWLIALTSPRWLRFLLLSAWALFQAMSQELLASMQRLPAWEDLQFLTDSIFARNSLLGGYLAYPLFSFLIFLFLLIAVFVPTCRIRFTWQASGATLAIAVLVLQSLLGSRFSDDSVASRYNPLHWFVRSSLSPAMVSTTTDFASLPPDLSRVDLDGATLLNSNRSGNVLIIVLEGISGVYHPELRQAMGVTEEEFTMTALAEITADAMLVPDFVTHSHQTIRGLYSILCGDFSKFSFETPKAFELQQNPERAGECLPARMAAAGWTTHFLQGASLNFMSKDRTMPLIGFQEVHGSEWFTVPDPHASIWGQSDPAFFKGVRGYIEELQTKAQPWLLTLLTVGTHHPYDVPDEVADLYPDRRTATVAVLDTAVAEFIGWLADQGILDDTLVIITSDESHGSAIAEWMSSWGICMVKASGQDRLPRLKSGTYGLVDIAPSILDYLNLEIPATFIGRSFFRDYDRPREMISYTGDKLRWHSADNQRYECTRGDGCWKGPAASLLGDPPGDFGPDEDNHASRLWAMAGALDHSLTTKSRSKHLQFAGGEIRRLPEKMVNEWSDNLAGAQYLHFPAKSKVYVSIRAIAVEAPDDGLQLQLFLRQNEHLVSDIDYPQFPLLRPGEEGKVEFDFINTDARQSFSFHLVGEGLNSTVQLEEFNVTVEEDEG